MEIRKIIIVESGGQKKSVIETGAETLAELKADLRANNIDYDGKTFFEGLSKTELLQDDSILPKDIMRNGVVTNNLVFMLTTPQKKIKSGMDRREAYEKIKEMGLQEECTRVFGKNFTLCKTEDLVNLINNHLQTEVCRDFSCEKEETYVDNSARGAIRFLVDVLYDNGCINSEEADNVLSFINDSPKGGVSSPYTDAEIDEILGECEF